MILLCAACASALRADVSDPPGGNNVPANSTLPELTNQAAGSSPTVETLPAPAPAAISSNPAASAQPANEAPRERPAVVVETGYGSASREEPRRFSRPDDSLVWIGLAGVSVISLSAIVISWQTSRKHLAVAPVPPVETHAAIVPALLPVISQAIKETLVQELAAQRRELLTAQQAAATELSQLARRLEAVQMPLLEQLGGPRNVVSHPATFPGQIPVKIYCPCGQKYSFEVQPVDGRMPFAVACPACAQDGTQQANQFIRRMWNGNTQPLPVPSVRSLGNPAPQPVEAVKQAVVKELAAAREESSTIATAAFHQSKNGSAPPEDDAGNFVTRLLTEGQSLADAGEFDKAVKCFETALALQPDRAEALVKLGGVLDRQGRADEALQHYDRAIALDESLTIAYLNKGGLFNRLARYDEALRCYEQALHQQKKTAA